MGEFGCDISIFVCALYDELFCTKVRVKNLSDEISSHK